MCEYVFGECMRSLDSRALAAECSFCWRGRARCNLLAELAGGVARQTENDGGKKRPRPLLPPFALTLEVKRKRKALTVSS